MRHALVRLLGISVAAAVLFLPASTHAQDTVKTTGLVGELVKLMDAAKADSIAAPVAGVPDQFVGAL